MSAHRPTFTSPRRRGRLDRRTRVVIAAVAIVALLGTAALIGRGDDGDESRVEMSTDAKARGGSSSEGAGGGGGADAATEGRSSTGASTTVVTGEQSEEGASDATAGAPPTAGAGGGNEAAPQLAAGAPADAKIIRTGTLDLEVADGKFEGATARLTDIATTAGGFVSASETSALDDKPRGSLTLRVPAAKFDAVVGDVGEVGDVQAVNTNSQDVTGEYTDVASRLKALQAEREQINLVLGRAENIPDILSVRDRLAIVQGEIEQLQGRQKVLDDQTSLSTLTVSLHEKGDRPTPTKAPEERSGFSKLWHDSSDRFTDGGRSIALGLASMAPWLLLGLVLFVPARVLWRRMAPVEAHETRPAAGPPPATTAD